MDNSILYGLRNPAMTEDIGMSMIERQYPTNITPLGYTPANITNKSAYFEQPYADTFQTKREKEYSTIKKVLVGLGVVALGILGIRKGTKGIKNAYSYIKNLFKGGKPAPTSATPTPGTGSVKNVFTKCKNVVVNVFNKGKNGITSLFNKIKTKISP